MGAFSLSHILVVALLALLLFGRGKLSELMGDVGKGESRPEPARITATAAIATTARDA